MDKTSPETIVFKVSKLAQLEVADNMKNIQQSCCFDQKCPSEQGSIAGHIVMMQQPVLLFPKFRP